MSAQPPTAHGFQEHWGYLYHRMRKLIGGVLAVMTVLVLSKYGSAPDAWTIQFGPDRPADADGPEHLLSPGARPAVGQDQRSEAQPSSLSFTPAAAHGAPLRSGWPSQMTASVVQVVDGDTITVRIGGRTETVRYIGVGAVAPTATDVNRRLLASGEVRLESDLQERDRAGRLLAYVHAETSWRTQSWWPRASPASPTTGRTDAIATCCKTSSTRRKS